MVQRVHVLVLLLLKKTMTVAQLQGLCEKRSANDDCIEKEKKNDPCFIPLYVNVHFVNYATNNRDKKSVSIDHSNTNAYNKSYLLDDKQDHSV